MGDRGEVRCGCACACGGAWEVFPRQLELRVVAVVMGACCWLGGRGRRAFSELQLGLGIIIIIQLEKEI